MTWVAVLMTNFFVLVSDMAKTSDHAKVVWEELYFSKIKSFHSHSVLKLLLIQIFTERKGDLHCLLNYSALQWILLHTTCMSLYILTALMDEIHKLKSYRFCRVLQCYFSSLFRLSLFFGVDGWRYVWAQWGQWSVACLNPVTLIEWIHCER